MFLCANNFLLYRILIGKEKMMKPDRRAQVLRFIAGCSEHDARKYVELAVDCATTSNRMGCTNMIINFVGFIDNSIYNVFHFSDVNPVKIVEMKLGKLSNCIKAWRYTFPKLLNTLLEKTCILGDMLQTEESLPMPIFEHPLPPQVFEEQKKTALKSCKACVLTFFNSVPKVNMDEDTVTKVFRVLIWPAIKELKNSCTSGVSWCLKLLSVWSQHSRFENKRKKSVIVPC